jgi:hypothetical protein
LKLRPEITWPQGSWLVSKLTGDYGARLIVTPILVITAGGLGLLFQLNWWRFVTAGSVALSSLHFFIFWNGKFLAMDDQGGIGILINLAILVVILVFNWPA